MYLQPAIGSPGKYGAVLAALNPHWLYTAATIADFGVKSGILQLSNPNPRLGTRELREKARISLGRRRANWGLPPSGDVMMPVAGRWFPACFGWRWQTAPNGMAAEAATRDLGRALAPLLADTDFTYTQLMRWSLETEIPPAPGLLRRLEDGAYRWRKIRDIQTALYLQRQALGQGMCLGHGYPLEDWFREEKGAGPCLPVPLKPILPHMKEGRVYGIEDLLGLAEFCGVLQPGSRTWPRIGLYDLARNSGFPELGDTLWTVDLEPAWYGFRWREAFKPLTFFTLEQCYA